MCTLGLHLQLYQFYLDLKCTLVVDAVWNVRREWASLRLCCSLRAPEVQRAASIFTGDPILPCEVKPPPSNPHAHTHTAFLHLNVSALFTNAPRNSPRCLWQPQVGFRFMPCQIARIPVSHSLWHYLRKGQLLLSWASLNFLALVGARWLGCYGTWKKKTFLTTWQLRSEENFVMYNLATFLSTSWVQSFLLDHVLALFTVRLRISAAPLLFLWNPRCFFLSYLLCVFFHLVASVRQLQASTSLCLFENDLCALQFRVSAWQGFAHYQE